MTHKVGVTTDTGTCFALRHQVFVVEQGVPVAEEIDDLDATATHLLAWVGADPVGAARIVFSEHKAKIGRVCVLADHRGSGLGQALITQAVEVAKTRGATQAILGAQLHALPFYAALGFRAFGPDYDDAGILHRDMGMDLT